MTGSGTRAFVTRLASLPVFDPGGDQVGKVRDVLVILRPGRQPPRVLGLVVEVPGRRRIFLPMGRVLQVTGDHVEVTGLLNMRRFTQRTTELRVLGDLLDRTVVRTQTGERVTVYDAAIEQQRSRDWWLSKVAVTTTTRRFRRGERSVLDWDEVDGFADPTTDQGAEFLLAAFGTMKATDLAGVLHDLPAKRRRELAAELDDERLADVLEELPDDDQIEIVTGLETERAAAVLNEMEPDDAADLVAELPSAQAEQLLTLMEPDDAQDVRRLMSYQDNTAGALMTTEPVILPPDASVADALARVRAAELSPALAAMVYVCRPPLQTPTGRMLGVAHIQRLLREPPSELASSVVDSDLDGLPPEADLQAVARYLAAYNLVSLPIVDSEHRLLGAVTVDDVLDDLLPEDWREDDNTDNTDELDPDVDRAVAAMTGGDPDGS